MRLVHSTTLVPYQEFPPTPDAREQSLARLHQNATRYSRPVTVEQEERWVNRLSIWDAEIAWLRANLPVGSVFSHMGIPMMVTSKAHRLEPLNKDQDFVGPQHYAVTVHGGGEGGGLVILELTVPELRAILEDGYTVPQRDPLHYGPEAEDDRA